MDLPFVLLSLKSKIRVSETQERVLLNKPWPPTASTPNNQAGEPSPSNHPLPPHQ